jgi:signal transduction histidine kinase
MTEAAMQVDGPGTAQTASARAPWIVAIVFAVVFVISIPLSFAARVNSFGDLRFLVPLVPAMALYLWIGATIASRTRNAIGWIFLSVVAFFSVGSIAGYYATLALVRHPGRLPFGVAAAWIDRWALTGSLTPFILVFLLFPTGNTPTRRWRWLLWTILSLIALEIFGLAITPGRITGAFADLTSIRVTNPLGVPIARPLLDTVTTAIGMALFASGLLSVVALIVRYRRAGSEERQQIRWLAYVGIAAAVSILAGFATDPGDRREGVLVIVNNVLFFTTFALLVLGIPVACGMAIMKYRLYDLDLVVRKTLVATVLLMLIAASSAAILLTVGQFALWPGTPRGVSVAVGILIGGILFGPLLHVARRVADRVVFGRRATPYEVLTDFSGRMADVYSTDDVLPRMASIVGAGTGASCVGIWLLVDGRLREAATWPEAADVASTEATRDDDRFEVRHQGELLGAIGISMPPSDPMNAAKRRVVRDLASQAGLVLRNVRLIEELRESRRRIVTAQDARARALERNIHDGAQQQLVALAVKLRLADGTIDRDHAAAHAALAQLQADALDALETLRDLARGIYPPLLADKGLPAALSAQAAKSAIPTRVSAEAVGRYPQETEAAVYFCALEALQNASKYSHASSIEIDLVATHGELRFEIRDDGVGFDTATVVHGVGLEGMTDRIEAIGGRLSIESAPPRGTRIKGSIPIPTGPTPDRTSEPGPADEPAQPAEPVATAQADSSRSGPNAAFGM